MSQVLTGLYIHIPFCIKKCIYCDFYSLEVQPPQMFTQYTVALLKELELYRDMLKDIRTIYIGGGTPTVLSIKDLSLLLSKIKDYVPKMVEFTCEANPGTLDKEKLKILKDSGVTRISLGVQSFNEKELTLLGRIHSINDSLKAVESIKALQFDLSIDLIYGIPGQNIEDWLEDLSRIKDIAPGHVSTYELTVEEKTPLWKEIISGRLKKPPEEEIIKMYEETVRYLENLGYIHYEVSNFSRPGEECLHNINYWKRGKYIGLGAKAHSFFGRKRIENYELRRYLSHVLKGLFPYKEIVHLTDRDDFTESIMLGMRMKEGINLDEFPEPFRKNLLKQTSPFIEQGLLIKNCSRLIPTTRGFIVLNEIILGLIS